MPYLNIKRYLSSAILTTHQCVKNPFKKGIILQNEVIFYLIAVCYIPAYLNNQYFWRLFSHEIDFKAPTDPLQYLRPYLIYSDIDNFDAFFLYRIFLR